jgi:hypothetical protein
LAQLSGAQIVPLSYLRQPEAPSHVPSVPHFSGPLSMQTPRGSTAPSGDGVHLPIDDGSAQLRQAPPHASSQQTPSTQNVLTHSPPPAQGCPFGLGPQLPALQTCPPTQSASLPQRAMQAPSVQR